MASSKGQFRVGDTVTHKKLGKGDILDVYPLGEDTCAVISFEKWGQKKIILKYGFVELVSRAAKAEAEGKEARQARESKAEAAAKDVPEVAEDAEVEGGEEES
jgi:hypothetical protein